MRKFLRAIGSLLILIGVGALAWAFVTWKWEDPLTSLYTAYEQRQLEGGLDRRFAEFRERGTRTAETRPTAETARAFRRTTSRGEAIGRITVPRLDLRMAFVYGTDTESLKRGPGLDPRTSFPGQGQLVYIAGHRTTYGAPFARIDALRKGDRITLELPYGTFVYTVTGSRIVTADNLSVLRSKGFEQVALQACHPRFFASHRWITYGKLVSRTAPGSLEALGQR